MPLRVSSATGRGPHNRGRHARGRSQVVPGHWCETQENATESPAEKEEVAVETVEEIRNRLHRVRHVARLLLFGFRVNRLVGFTANDYRDHNLFRFRNISIILLIG